MSFTIDNYASKLDTIQKKLKEVPEINDDLLKADCTKLKDILTELRKTADQLLSDSNILRIGVVGQVKAGKSSFLNSLLFDGENVLPRAATPMTAGLTVIEYGEENEFEVEYFNSSEWKLFEDRAAEYDSIMESLKSADPEQSIQYLEKSVPEELRCAKEMVEAAGAAKLKITSTSKKEIEKFSSVSDMQDILGQYVGASGKFTSVVKCLTIRLHEDRLKDIQVVDTPGVNDPVISREERTKQFLSGCHGVFFLSYSGRFFDSTDVNFLVNRIGNQGIGTVVVIASKFDSVLQDTGDKYDDDLGGACEYCEKALRKQMVHNIQNSDFKGQMPVLDFSSGIGYSISHKSLDRLDRTEQNVVEQMKRFYPSFFASDDDIKETFNDLSRIDDIKVNYLEKVFKSNKDKIIAEKVGGFVSGMHKQISDHISVSEKRADTQLKALENGDAEKIRNQKASFEAIINKLRGQLNRYIVSTQNDLKTAAIDIKNDCYLSDITIKTSQENKRVHRYTTFWGSDSYVNVICDCVDVSATCSIAKKNIETICKNLLEKWRNNVETLKNTLFSKINDIIAEAETKDINFDADLLRDFIEDAISKINAYRAIDISTLKEMSHELEDQFQRIPELKSSVGTASEDDAKSEFKESARSRLNRFRNAMNQWKTTVNAKMEKLLSDKVKEVDAVLASENKEMLDSVSEKTETYFSQLNEKMKNIENSKQEYVLILNKLREMKQVIK